jgi:hypothetical protein
MRIYFDNFQLKEFDPVAPVDFNDNGMADLGDYQKTAYYQGLYIRLNGEIFNGDLIKNISRISTDYQEQENLKTIAKKDEILELNGEVIFQQQMLATLPLN